MDDFWKRTKQDDDESFNQFPYVPFPRPIPVPIPGIFDPPTKCLVINVEWAARFMGACEALDQVDVWLTDPAGAEAARNQIREALASWMTGEGCLMVDPCCPETNDLLIDINLNNQQLIFQSVINRYQANLIANQQIAFQLRLFAGDGSDIHSFAPDAPDTSFSEDSSDSTPELVTARAAALCSAIDRYVDTCCAGITMDGNIAGGIINGTISAVLGVIFWPIGVGYGIATGIAMAAWNAAVNDPQGKRKVKCCMYDNLIGQDITFEVFRESIADCAFDPNSSEGIISGGIHQWNGSIEQFRAFVAMLGGEMSTLAPGGSGNACDCSCGTPSMTIGTMIDHGDGSYTMTSAPITVEINPDRVGFQAIRFEVDGCCEILSAQVIDDPVAHLSYWIGCDDVIHDDFAGGTGAALNEPFKFSLVYESFVSGNTFSIKYILTGS